MDIVDFVCGKNNICDRCIFNTESTFGIDRCLIFDFDDIIY